MQASETAARSRRRGIYLLPNLFTTGGLFAGFFAIVAAIAGNWSAAAAAIFVAWLMDGLDGRIARLTRTQSAFGEQYDSMADLVSFGIAPALVVYMWSLHWLDVYGWQWARAGWLAAFVYVVTAALRLARFNARAHTVDKRWFQGLPSPSGAALIAGGVWLGQSAGFGGRALVIPALVVTILAGLLMVSSIPYYGFKNLKLQGRVPFAYVLVVPLIFVVVAFSPPKTLFFLFFVYAMSGPVLWVGRIVRRRRIARDLENRRN